MGALIIAIDQLALLLQLGNLGGHGLDDQPLLLDQLQVPGCIQGLEKRCLPILGQPLACGVLQVTAIVDVVDRVQIDGGIGSPLKQDVRRHRQLVLDRYLADGPIVERGNDAVLGIVQPGRYQHDVGHSHDCHDDPDAHRPLLGPFEILMKAGILAQHRSPFG